MPDVKEQEPTSSSQREPLSPLEGGEVSEEPERSPEVESVIEKLERQRAQKTGDAQDDTTVVPASDQPAVTLPVTQDDMVQGKKLPILASLRWLVEWAVRQIKKLGGRARYHEPEVE